MPGMIEYSGRRSQHSSLGVKNRTLASGYGTVNPVYFGWESTHSNFEAAGRGLAKHSNSKLEASLNNSNFEAGSSELIGTPYIGWAFEAINDEAVAAPYSELELNDPSFETRNFSCISPLHPPQTELGIISPSFGVGNAAVDDSRQTRF